MAHPTIRVLLAWLIVSAATAPLLSAPAPLRRATAISVYDALRDGNDDTRPDLLGKSIVLNGVLTLRPATTESNDVWISFLQDETGGLRIRGRGPGEDGLTKRDRATQVAWFTNNFKEGDQVAVRGVLSAVNDTVELRVDEPLLIASGEPPRPREVWSTDLDSRHFEAQLVRMSGTIERGPRDRQLEFFLRDAHGRIPLVLQPEFFMSGKGEFGYRMWKGGEVEVTGIAVRNPGAPASAGLALLLRKPADMWFVPPPPPPPSRTPLYLALGAAAFMGLLAAYYWERRRIAEERHRETSRLLHELKRSQAEIKKQASFAALSPNPVIELFADGTLTYWNPAAKEMTERLECGFVRDLLPPNLSDLVTKCLASPHAPIKAELKIKDRTLAWTFFAIPEITSVHAYGMDITEQLSLEAQLRQAQKIESVGQLAAGVAHDFNNMLAVIQGYASLTLLRNELPPKLTESLSEILSAAERARNLTRQLLTFSRKQVMEQRTLDLNDLVANLTKMLRRLIGADVRLRFTRGAAPACVQADAGMMEQIVVNLAVNARDAMPDGGDISVELHNVTLTESDAAQRFEARAGEFVCLTVTDNGCGMDEATLKRIFEPFFTTKEPGKGTGLGLATVHGIVKQHGGWIEVSSQPKHGTTFRIYLPAASAAAPPADGKVIPLPVAGGTETILVVEDDAAVRKFARGVLEEYGYGVFDAGSGAEALAIWREHREKIRLLLTDIVLPDGLSGWKLAEQLRRDRPELKVIYSTGFDSDTLNGRSDVQLSNVVLRKPYPVQTLVRAIRDCLDNGPTAQAMNT